MMMFMMTYIFEINDSVDDDADLSNDDDHDVDVFLNEIPDDHVGKLDFKAFIKLKT